MTRKNYRNSLLLILITLAVLAGFVGCTEGPVGIFASIAQEKDINANRTAAFDGTSPDFVGILDTNYYTIINGTIWTRPVAGGKWIEVAPPTGIAQGEASSAAIAGTHLYVVFGKIGDSNQKVWAKETSTAWDDTLATFIPPVRIDSLLSAGNQLFAITRADTGSPIVTEYTLHYLNLTTFTATAVANTSGRPTSIAYDGISDYWITAGTSVFSGAPGGLTPVIGTPADTFAGVVQETGTEMILSSKTGKLYKHDGAWDSSSAFEKDGDPHAFSAPAIVTAGGASYLLVGTVSGNDAATASGYLEFDIPLAGFDPTTASASEGSDFADIVNFLTSVSINYITSFSVADEGVGKRVFALTVGNGLWSNYFNGTTWSGWARE
ncbi:MAG: hypothetical protein RBT68_00635 [Spirochaetia bacterium]|jgi:hypothetical protein|nr:hypothetical protein [Spirochaetia bacterium]